MNYPVGTVAQLRAVLRALRKDRQLSQSELGQLIGVNQKRVAKIEAAPGVTSFDQIARIVAMLGGQIVIEHLDDTVAKPVAGPAAQAKKKSKRASRGAATW
jgi:HTH-type transcriptional regulator/antitoxin HipB